MRIRYIRYIKSLGALKKNKVLEMKITEIKELERELVNLNYPEIGTKHQRENMIKKEVKTK